MSTEPSQTRRTRTVGTPFGAQPKHEREIVGLDDQTKRLQPGSVLNCQIADFKDIAERTTCRRGMRGTRTGAHSNQRQGSGSLSFRKSDPAASKRRRLILASQTETGLAMGVLPWESKPSLPHIPQAMASPSRTSSNSPRFRWRRCGSDWHHSPRRLVWCGTALVCGDHPDIPGRGPGLALDGVNLWGIGCGAHAFGFRGKIDATVTQHHMVRGRWGTDRRRRSARL